MEIIPAVDVLDGSVVRLAKGDYSQVTTYAADPVEQSLRWQRQGAALIHVVDLDGARTGDPNTDLWGRLTDAGVRFQVGGGIRTPQLASTAVAAGAERVLIGTAAVWTPNLVDAMLAELGAGRIIAAVDVRYGRATAAGWRDQGLPMTQVVGRLARQGIKRVLVTGIERDGMLTGPDLELLTRVQDAAPGLSLIAGGGVGSLEDLEQLASIGVEAAIIGRALYEGRFSLQEGLPTRQERDDPKRETETGYR